MASFRLCHRCTGQPIPGYRVTEASEMEIALANQRLRETGTPFRFVIDLHPPAGVARAIAGEETTLVVSTPTA